MAEKGRDLKGYNRIIAGNVKQIKPRIAIVSHLQCNNAASLQLTEGFCIPMCILPKEHVSMEIASF